MLSSVSIGFREIGRKLRRRKLRKTVKVNLRLQAAQTAAIGEQAWSSELAPSGSEELRSALAALEGDQSAVASKRTSIDEQKANLEQERDVAAAGFDGRRKELDAERRGKSERVAQAKKAHSARRSELAALQKKDAEGPPDPLEVQKLETLVAAAAAELAERNAELKVVDDKLKVLARERKKVVGALEKKISEAQKAIAGTQREDVSLGSRKKELLSSLGQMIVERRSEDASLATDSPVAEGLQQLAETEAERSRLDTEIISLQAETDALPSGVMGKFYGLVALGLLTLALLVWLSWFLMAGGESDDARRETATSTSSAVSSESRSSSRSSSNSQSTRPRPTRRSDADLDELIETLQTGDASDKADAGRALGEIGENAVAPVLEVLSSRNEEQRANAAFAVAEMIDLAPDAQAQVTPALIDTLEDDYWRARANAALALGNLRNGDTAAFRALRSTLADEDARVRAAAAYAIGELGVDPGDSVPVLVERLESDDVPDVRVVAANALALTDSAAAVPALLGAVQDQHWEVSYASMSALGFLREKSVVALPTLIEMTAQLTPYRGIVPAQSVKMIVEGAGPGYDVDRETLGAIAQRLDLLVRAARLSAPRYGSPAAAALAILVQWLPGERTRIAEGLDPLIWQSPDGSSAPVGDEALPVLMVMADLSEERDSDLIDKLEDPDRIVRWAAASALGLTGSERAVPALAVALADEEPMVQTAAARSLAELDAESVEALVGVLGHQNPDARVHAAFALASIGRNADEEDVVPALQDALQDDEFRVRYAVSCALKNVQRIIACDPESILAPAGWRGR